MSSSGSRATNIVGLPFRRQSLPDYRRLQYTHQSERKVDRTSADCGTVRLITFGRATAELAFRLSNGLRPGLHHRVVAGLHRPTEIQGARSFMPAAPPSLNSGNDRSRVLIVNSTLHIGGAEQVAACLAQGIDRAEFDVAACYLKEPGLVADRMTAAGVELL